MIIYPIYSQDLSAISISLASSRMRIFIDFGAVLTSEKIHRFNCIYSSQTINAVTER